MRIAVVLVLFLCSCTDNAFNTILVETMNKNDRMNQSNEILSSQDNLSNTKNDNSFFKIGRAHV